MTLPGIGARRALCHEGCWGHSGDTAGLSATRNRADAAEVWGGRDAALWGHGGGTEGDIEGDTEGDTGGGHSRPPHRWSAQGAHSAEPPQVPPAAARAPCCSGNAEGTKRGGWGMDGGLSATLPTPKWGDSSAVTQRPPLCRRGGGPRRASAPWLQQQRPAPTAGRRRCAPRSRSRSSPAGFDGGFYEGGGLKMSRITALSPPSSPPDPPRPAQRSARAAAPPAAPPSPAAPAAAPRAASPPPAPAPTARPQPGGHKIGGVGGGEESANCRENTAMGGRGELPPFLRSPKFPQPPPLLSPNPPLPPIFPLGPPFCPLPQLP